MSDVNHIKLPEIWERSALTLSFSSRTITDWESFNISQHSILEKFYLDGLTSGKDLLSTWEYFCRSPKPLRKDGPASKPWNMTQCNTLGTYFLFWMKIKALIGLCFVISSHPCVISPVKQTIIFELERNANLSKIPKNPGKVINHCVACIIVSWHIIILLVPNRDKKTRHWDQVSKKT